MIEIGESNALSGQTAGLGPQLLAVVAPGSTIVNDSVTSLLRLHVQSAFGQHATPPKFSGNGSTEIVSGQQSCVCTVVVKKTRGLPQYQSASHLLPSQ